MPHTQSIAHRTPRSRHARARAAEQPSRLSELRGSLAWGAAGFVLGALCWHVIGFWSFVSDVVLKGPEERAPLEAAAPPSTPAHHNSKPVTPIRATMAGVRNRPKADVPACSEAVATSAGAVTRVCPPGTAAAAVDRPVMPRADKLDLIVSGAPSGERELSAQRHATPPAPTASGAPVPLWSTTIAAPRR